MNHVSTGADLHSEVPTPTLDMAALSDALAKALVPSESAPDALFLHYDRHKNSLRLNTLAVLKRLETTALVTNEGFLRHVEPPRQSWQTVRVGGRLVPGTEVALRKEILKLADQINAEFDALCIRENLQPRQFVITDVEPQLKTMGKRVDGFLDRMSDQAITRLQTIAFTSPNAPIVPDQVRVGRVMSATETSETANPLEVFLEALGRKMRYQGYSEPDEIHSVLNDWRMHYQRGDRQLQMFFNNFLPDAAQSRIRMAVARDLMDAIRQIALNQKDAGAQLAAEYIRRVLVLHDAFTVSDSDDAEFALEPHYGPGSGANFLLSTELVKYTFYFCLPVWCDWAVQILEAPTVDNNGQPALIRQLSYRFKVNGYNPEKYENDRETAFQRSVRQLKETLLPNAEASAEYARLSSPLAELLTLAVVVPRGGDEQNEQSLQRDVDVAQKARDAVAYFNSNGQDAIRKTIAHLEERAPVMSKIASAIVKILRRPGTIINALAHQPRTYYLNVLPSILDTEPAFQGMEAPLIKPSAHQDQRTAFFSAVRVTTGEPLPEALFSQRVTVRLTELLLYAPRGELTQNRVQRQAPHALLQIVWQPTVSNTPSEADSIWINEIEKWRLPVSLTVEYSVAALGIRDPKHYSERLKQSEATVRRVAFTVLVYVALQTLCKRFIADGPKLWKEMVALMLRFQQQGRDAKAMSGDSALYAAAQTIEHALGQHLRTRMQGVSSGGLLTNKHLRKNSFNALLSAFPMMLQTSRTPTLNRIGVLSFMTRPATTHPALTEDTQQDFVLVGRTYMAITQPPFSGYRLVANPSLLAIESGRDVFSNSPAITDAIDRLYRNGCRHILYLGHRWHGRQIGRAAPRHRHHEQPSFLAEIRRRYPDLHLYPLVHDVFPATRLYQRKENEDAFEVLDYPNHLKTFSPDLETLRGDLLMIPIYTLATLHVIKDESGEDGRPQSAFATYFLLGDATPERLEQESRQRLDLISADSPIRHDVLAVLRGLHYLESEAPAVKSVKVPSGTPSVSCVRPVLNPYAALQPVSIAAAGEIVVHPSSKMAGEALLSLPAVLARIASILTLRDDPIHLPTPETT